MSAPTAVGEGAESVVVAPRAGIGLGELRDRAKRWTLVIAFVLAVGFFGAIEPATFLTWDNARAILEQSAPLAILALGVTVVLVLGEFDLSVGATVGVGGATAVVAMSELGAPMPTAVFLGLLAGATVGLINGVSVAYFGIPSFIATLAVGTLAGGFELAIAGTTIFDGIASSYEQIAQGNLFGEIPLPIVIGGAIAAGLAFALRETVFGRNATAIGDNPAAASLAGVPVLGIRIAGFVIAGVAAAVTGVLLSANAASFYPDPGTGLLLPAYAAAFLGLSLGGGWRFNVAGTLLGVTFLGTITTGLVMLDQPAWIASMIQGAVLLASVVALARRSGGLFG